MSRDFVSKAVSLFERIQKTYFFSDLLGPESGTRSSKLFFRPELCFGWTLFATSKLRTDNIETVVSHHNQYCR